MPDIPLDPLAPDKPESGKTFFGGVTLKAFKALTHREQMAVMRADDARRQVRPVEHTCPVYGTRWKTLTPKDKQV